MSDETPGPDESSHAAGRGPDGLFHAVRRAREAGPADGVRVDPDPGEMATAVGVELDTITEMVRARDPGVGYTEARDAVASAYLAAMHAPELADVSTEVWRRAVADRAGEALAGVEGDES